MATLARETQNTNQNSNVTHQSIADLFGRLSPLLAGDEDRLTITPRFFETNENIIVKINSEGIAPSDIEARILDDRLILRHPRRKTRERGGANADMVTSEFPFLCRVQPLKLHRSEHHNTLQFVIPKETAAVSQPICL